MDGRSTGECISDLLHDHLLVRLFTFSGPKTLSSIGIDKKPDDDYRQGFIGICATAGGSNGEGNGTPLQYSCLENPTDGGAW